MANFGIEARGGLVLLYEEPPIWYKKGLFINEQLATEEFLRVGYLEDLDEYYKARGVYLPNAALSDPAHEHIDSDARYFREYDFDAGNGEIHVVYGYALPRRARTSGHRHEYDEEYHVVRGGIYLRLDHSTIQPVVAGTSFSVPTGVWHETFGGERWSEVGIISWNGGIIRKENRHIRDPLPRNGTILPAT